MSIDTLQRDDSPAIDKRRRRHREWTQELSGRQGERHAAAGNCGSAQLSPDISWRISGRTGTVERAVARADRPSAQSRSGHGR